MVRVSITKVSKMLNLWLLGFTDPYIQFSATYEWLCDGKWGVFDKSGPECAKLKDATQACQRLIHVSFGRSRNPFESDRFQHSSDVRWVWHGLGVWTSQYVLLHQCIGTCCSEYTLPHGGQFDEANLFIQKTGLNPYDARQKCDLSESHPVCYPYDDWITKYLNKPEIRKELGVPLEKKFLGE